MSTPETKPANPPAFPQQAFLSSGGTVETANGYFADMDGMSLRDYFAAKADIPWSAVLDTLSIKSPERDGKFSIAEVAKQRCAMKYIEADAMLAARAEQP